MSTPPSMQELEVAEIADETAPTRPPRRFWALLLSSVIVAGMVYGCAYYASLSRNDNGHLGAEYHHIAKSLIAGEGYANPFGTKTGPTAWMPPVLPTILAGILWLCENDGAMLQTIVVALQVHVLLVTGLLVIALARTTSHYRGIMSFVAAAVFGAVLLSQYRLCFLWTHDCWLVLLAVDLLVIGLCWFRPLQTKTSAAVWGTFGGFFSLINPIVGFTWTVIAVVDAVRQRNWKPLGVALLMATLVHAPWTIRNYLLFGRLIPIKSNLAYELYQSQCLQKDGLLQSRTFGSHPYVSNNQARHDYKALGEIAFLDGKNELFWKAVAADPLDFCDRVASRFLGALVWYETFQHDYERNHPWVTRLNQALHPLPFLALILLAFSAIWRPLHPAQWAVMAVFFLYQMPYVGISYYERYAIPLLGVKAVLIVWLIDRVLTLAIGPAATGKSSARFSG